MPLSFGLLLFHGKHGVQAPQLLHLCTITPYPIEQQSYTEMIRITPSLWLDESELEETFVRASGPGGQHVNKTSSAVQLRFDARHSRSLPADVAERLIELAGNRATQEGILVITAQSHRSQPLNRADALERLVTLIRRATERQAIRRPTAPTRASKRRRLDEKSRRGQVKALRRGTQTD